MSLPIKLAKGYYSIIDSVSPNSIIMKLPYKCGLIDDVSNLFTPQFGIGQYVLYRDENTSQVVYNNKTYFIVNEKNIFYAENPFVPV